MFLDKFTEGVVVTHGTTTKGSRAAGPALDESLAGGVGEVPDLPPLSFIESIPAFMRRAFRPVRARRESVAAGLMGAEEASGGYPVGERLAVMEREWKGQEAVLRACGRSEDEISEHYLSYTIGFWRSEVTRGN